MQLDTAEQCRAYVEAELQQLHRTHPQWRAARASDVHLRWNVNRGKSVEEWYTLEARMDHREFLIWFGNHQGGVEDVPWIVRPAVHVAFDDLWPRSDPVAIRASLGDVLAYMIGGLNLPEVMMTRFELNTFSLT